MEQQAKKQFLINFLYALVLGVIAFVLCRFLFVRMFPFVLSVIIAALAQKPAGYLSRKTGIKKSFFAVFLSASIYIGVAAMLIFLIWRIIMSFSGIIEFLPQIFKKITDIFEDFEGYLSGYLPKDFNISFGGIMQNLLKTATDFLTEIIKKSVKAAPSVLFSGVVALVAGCYISKDFDGLAKFVKSLCKKGFYEKFLRIKNIISKSVFKIVKGYLILMIITFFEVWIGLLILRVSNAFLIAAIIALIDFLPVLGTGIIMIPWSVYCALSGNIRLAVGVAVLYITVVILRNFSEPKIVSHQIGINPLFTLVSMFLGLRLLGGFGLIIFPLVLIVTVNYYKQEMEIL